MDLLTLVFTFTSIIADSDSSAAEMAPLVLFASGFIFYGIMYARYRNADKRHYHERETSASIANLAGIDNFIRSRKGLSNPKMVGANSTRIEGALNQSGTADKLLEKFTPNKKS